MWSRIPHAANSSFPRHPIYFRISLAFQCSYSPHPSEALPFIYRSNALQFQVPAFDLIPLLRIALGIRFEMVYSMVVRSCVLTLVMVLVIAPAHAQSQCNTTLLQAVAAIPALVQLAAIIERAGLSDMLNSTDLNVTVLAPNNAAINGTGGLLQILQQNNLTLDQVTAEDNNRAASIILYHIIPVPATAAQLSNGQVLPTSLEGRNLTVSKTNPTPTTISVTFIGAANNATVVTPDVRVCNSVVHVVNRVLLPNATLTGIPIYNDNTSTPGIGNGASGLAIGTWAFAISGALAAALVM